MNETERTDWLAARRQGIGGSDAAAIVGLDPWRSAIEVYLDKLGDLPDEDAGESAAWGNRLEAVVADHFADDTGLEVLPAAPMQWSALYPWAFANVDRLVREPGADEVHGILEVKTTGAHMADGWEQGPPDRVLIQVHHYLAVLDLRVAYVAVLIGGQRFRTFTIERDDDLIAQLVELEREFWNCVEARTPPAPDASESAARALARLYADVEKGSAVELPADATELVEHHRATSMALEQLETEKRRLSNALKALMGDHAVGTLEGRKVVTWTRYTQSKLDRAGLEAEAPALVAKYLTDEPRERFTVSKGDT
jgi:putative phage-type endonuclease